MDSVEIVTGQTGALSPAQQEAMAKEQGQPQEQPQAEPQAQEQAEPQEQTEQPKGEAQAPEEKLAAFSQEFFTTGKLSDESYKNLEGMGYPKAIVDQFIAGQQAVMAREEQAVYDSVGGKETYANMTKWASQNLGKDEIEAYNAAISSGNPAQVKFAVQGLQARFTANTREPSLVAGGKAAPAGFRSVAEVVAAMSDPKYKVDPAYRAEVERKIANSNVL